MNLCKDGVDIKVKRTERERENTSQINLSFGPLREIVMCPMRWIRVGGGSIVERGLYLYYRGQSTSVTVNTPPIPHCVNWGGSHSK